MDSEQKGIVSSKMEGSTPSEKNFAAGAIKKSAAKTTRVSVPGENKQRKDTARKQRKKDQNSVVKEGNAHILSNQINSPSSNCKEVRAPSRSSDGSDFVKKSHRKKHTETKARPSYSSPLPKPKTPESACGSADYARSLPKTPNLSSGRKSRHSAKSPQKSLKFEPYIPLFEVQQGLKRGEFIEGALRINPRNYEDAYINSPDGQMDIYIGGMHDRNRALNGDLVVVKVNPKQEWKVLCDAIKDHQGKHGPLFVEEICVPDSTPCKIHTPERFSRLPSGASSLWNDAAGPRLPDSLQIMGVDKLAEQLGELSVHQKKKKNRRKNLRARNKGSASSKESSNPQSSATSYSHGSSDDILNQKSSDNTPEHYPDVEANLQNGIHDVSDAKGEENKSGFCVQQDLSSNFSPLEIGAPSEPENKEFQSNNKTTWDDPQSGSTNIVTSPDVLLDFSNDNALQQLCDQYIPKNGNLLEEGSDEVDAIIVAPDDLSGDEFTESASTTSSQSRFDDQVLEDTEFFSCQQDIQNNNSESSWNEQAPVNNVAYLNSARLEDAFVQQPECDASDVTDGSGICAQLRPGKLAIHAPSYSLSSRDHIPVNPIAVPTMALKTPKIHKKKADSMKLRKRKKSKTKKILQKTTSTDNSNVTVEVKPHEVESLSVEEILKHPLWPKFVQKTGKVVHILERKHSTVAMGHIKLLQDKNPRFALFSPKDNRLPRMMIPMSDCPTNFYERPQDFKQFLYLARLEEWREDSTFAAGRLIKRLGNVQQIGAHTEGILYENGVDFDEFPPEVISSLPNSSWVIPDHEIAKRVDYRDSCIFTIDPATARDMDDAVSCEVLENGNFEVGVHIADVTHFVREGTNLNEFAKNRATSVYLVQMVVPMLPRVLCDDLCSLTPGRDRLTFSVVWEMNRHAEVISHRFQHSIIKSCIKLSYEHAQEMIDNPRKKWEPQEHPPLYGPFQISSVVERVNMLHLLAVQLRSKRFNDGALQLNQVKLQFSLCQETGMPLGFQIYEQKDSHRLIEEFMLLANMEVAKQIYNSFPEIALLRRHPPPQTKPMEDVVRACAQMGIHLDSSSSGSLQASISRYISSDALSFARHLVLTHLCSKPMNCALYFCSGMAKHKELFEHYALSVPYYTHFTSPIRRYPDIIVHRLLSASLGVHPVPNIKPSQMQLDAEHCNTKKYNAKRVSEQSDEIFLSVFIQKSGSVTAQAMVVSVLDHSFDCLILQFGIVKRIYCDKLPLAEKKFTKHEGVQSLTLVWKVPNSSLHLRQTILMFSLVTVTLKTGDEMQIVGTLNMPSSDQLY